MLLAIFFMLLNIKNMAIKKLYYHFTLSRIVMKERIKAKLS